MTGDSAPAETVAFDGTRFFDRARAALNFEVPAALADVNAPSVRGDHENDPAVWELVGSLPSRQAAVLVPVVAREEPTVLLTLRSSRLPNHAGQVAFPGGKIEESDHSPLAAALREAEEEIGLTPNHVEPLGYLDLYLTVSGYRILPAVARVEPGYALNLNPGEVDDAFEVPLEFLMRPENHQRHSREWRGLMRSYYAMPFGERYIWGVTAGILRNLFERLYA